MIGVRDESGFSMALRKLLPSLFFIALIVEAGFRSSWINIGGHAYQDGDWLINYSGGFVRRGLFGSLILGFHLGSHATLNLLLAFQLLCYLILIFALVSFLQQHDFSWPSVIFTLSPAGFMFMFLDQTGGFRKEIILYAAISFLYLSTKSQKWKQWLFGLFIAFFSLGVFSWDGIAFFAPFVIFTLFSMNKNGFINKTQRNFSAWSVGITSLISLVISVLYEGTIAQAEVICSGLKINHGFAPRICDFGGGNGAIRAIGWPTSQFLHSVQHSFPGYLVYFLFLALALLPFMMFLDRKIFLGLLKFFPLTLPLFILAIDYGRWLSLFIILITLRIMIDRVEINHELNIHPLIYMAYISGWGFQHYFGHFHYLNLIGKLWAISTGAPYPPLG